MTRLTENIFAVEIPEDVQNVIITDCMVCDNWADEEFMPLERLPHNDYTLLFLSKEATEDDWENVCDSDVGGGELDEKTWLEWLNYETDEYSFDTATESGHRLLRSKGLDPSKNYAIIKNNQL